MPKVLGAIIVLVTYRKHFAPKKLVGPTRFLNQILEKPQELTAVIDYDGDEYSRCHQRQNREIARRIDRRGIPHSSGLNSFMKLIIAIIQPTKLEAVKDALSRVEVFRLTVMDVQGFGRQKGYTEVYRGHEVTVNLLRKIELQIAVNEDFVEPTVNAILEAGRSGPDGKIGDGKIFILPLDDCIRIRTGERGPEAI
jgi:nitrogen regulatory protein P-II 2